MTKRRNKDSSPTKPDPGIEEQLDADELMRKLNTYIGAGFSRGEAFELVKLDHSVKIGAQVSEMMRKMIQKLEIEGNID